MSSSCSSACAWQCWWEHSLVGGLCFLCSRFSEPDPSHTLEERVVHWYFSQLDNNSSNDINKRELKPFKRYVKKKAKPKKCARRFTDYCDLNKDKSISLQELKGCLGVSKEGGECLFFFYCIKIKTELQQTQESVFSQLFQKCRSLCEHMSGINILPCKCSLLLVFWLHLLCLITDLCAKHYTETGQQMSLGQNSACTVKSLETVVQIRSLLNNTLLTRFGCLSHAGWMMYEPAQTHSFSGDPVD